MDTLTKPISAPRRRTTADTVYPILLLVSVTHLLNDMMQSVIPAVYPLLKAKFGFSFAQIGLITLVFQMTSSILQPFVGRYADRHPRPYSLAAGMCFTLAGLFALALAPGFAPILLAVALIGWGSSIFHPESSRVAQLASGGRKGLAQSIFQVRGNAGSAFGPLLAALVVIPYGQTSIMWFAPAALLAIGILMALYKRERTGEGGHVDVAMVDTMIHILDHFIIDYTILGEKHSRSGNNDQSIAPFDSFAAKDGMFVLACGTDGMFAKLCGLMERPDLLEDARYATNYDRCCNYAALKPEIERWSTTRTVDELEEAILAIGIPFGRIQDVEQVVKNPQTTARNMLWDVDQPGMGRITITGTPIKISYEEDKLIKAAPVMGEDNARILETLGYTPQDLAALSKKGVI